jgi:hypothetical protein
MTVGLLFWKTSQNRAGPNLKPKLAECFFEVGECDTFTWIGYLLVAKLTSMGEQKL